jgi:hypothetical protein
MRHIIKLIVGILILTLAACGPSPEQVATMTASAWTPTPPPTATSTPIPYDVNVSIVDTGGVPIAEAQSAFPESGNSDPVMSDAQGKFSWTNLAGVSANFNVSAQGYFPAQQSAMLQRGVNEVGIVLKRAPFAFLPSTACGAGETLLYMEDFQDGESQNWNGDQANSSSRFVGPAPDASANFVYIFDATKLTLGPDAWLGANYNAGESAYFGDAVWRLHFMVNRFTAPTFNWHEAGPSEFGGQEATGTRYTFNFWGSPFNQIHLRRTIFGAAGPLSDDDVVTGTFTQVPNNWHWLEISSFQGHLQIWVDGKLEAEYQDPEPLPVGRIGIGLGPFTEASTTVLYFDDMTVCGLSAPFTSMPLPIPAP